MLANEASNFFFFFLGSSGASSGIQDEAKQGSEDRATDAHPAASTLSSWLTPTSLSLSLPLLMVWFGKNPEPG